MICCRSESGGLLENLTIRQEEKKMEGVKIMNKKILAAALSRMLIACLRLLLSYRDRDSFS